MARGTILTALRRVPHERGDVLHGMKLGDPGYAGFGEAYFSLVRHGAVKGWKRHRIMTLNLLCPSGAVRFVVHDGRSGQEDWLDVVLRPDEPGRYRRLTVPPGLWLGFEGVGQGENVVLNIASCPHDPHEAETRDLADFAWPAS